MKRKHKYGLYRCWRCMNLQFLAGSSTESRRANQWSEVPQVAAGENPFLGMTDYSQGRELTREWDIKTRRRHTPIVHTARVATGLPARIIFNL